MPAYLSASKNQTAKSTAPLPFIEYPYVASCGMNVFDEMGSYWAEIADESQTQKQIRFVKTVLPPDRWVLDLACGTARHSIALTKDGYGMVGLDVSAKLLHIAKGGHAVLAVYGGSVRGYHKHGHEFGVSALGGG
jgi:SAM-dependent methyltransferase